MRDALTTFRYAVKPTAEVPDVTLDLDIPLPMAALVGYECRVTSRLKLTIRQCTRSGFPDWAKSDLPGTGPAVVAVSTTPEPLTGPLAQYAHQVRARRTLDLHLPGERDATRIRALAPHIAGTLRDINKSGQPKHLLLAGPASLATLAGAAANADGPVTMPLWNGNAYRSAMTFGG